MSTVDEPAYVCDYCGDEFTCCEDCATDPEPPRFCSTEHAMLGD